MCCWSVHVYFSEVETWRVEGGTIYSSSGINCLCITTSTIASYYNIGHIFSCKNGCANIDGGSLPQVLSNAVYKPMARQTFSEWHFKFYQLSVLLKID
jgi:hypothetical protein